MSPARAQLDTKHEKSGKKEKKRKGKVIDNEENLCTPCLVCRVMSGSSKHDVMIEL